MYSTSGKGATCFVCEEMVLQKREQDAAARAVNERSIRLERLFPKAKGFHRNAEPFYHAGGKVGRNILV